MGRHITYIALILSWAWVASAPAQQVPTTITRTAGAGDLGTKVNKAGKSFDINGGTRPSNGPNLFHSFDQFSLGSGDTANFVNDTNLATQNILSRVTGGSRSDIFGTIKTTGFPGADLFLLNPAGVVFGADAELDVQGSFHASTGDFIRLSDGLQFNALPSGQDALLSTAPPSAFGFLGDHPASIAFQDSKLEVPEGKTLSVVGGNIAITGGSVLKAPGGQVNVASVASAGEVTLGSETLGTGSFSHLGQIDLNDSTIDVSEAEDRATGGGRVLIRGGQLVMDNSQVLANTTNGDGKGIDIKLTGRLELTDGLGIRTNTTGAGKGGDLQVEAQDILLEGGDAPDKRSGLYAYAEAGGAAGRITVIAERLRLRTGVIRANTYGDGDAGHIDIKAGEVGLEGKKSVPSAISAETSGPGRGGDITIRADHLRLTGSQISVSTKWTGQAGSIAIDAGEIVLGKPDGDLPQPTIFTRSEGEYCGEDCGPGGDITIKADRLQLKDGAAISAGTNSSGHGASLKIDAKDVILENGFKHPDPDAPGQEMVTESSLDATTAGEAADCGEDCGGGGRITVKAERLQLKRGAAINVSTGGSGAVGNITIKADEVVLEGRFDSSVKEGGFEAVLSARTRGDGQRGNITIEAGRLELKGNAAIRADTRGPGKGGDVSVDADRVLLSGDGSPDHFTGILAETNDAGDAGSVTVKARELQVSDGAQITTSTLGDGDAGLIDVDAETIKLVNRGRIASASGSDPDAGKLIVGTGNARRVSVDAKRLEMTGGGSIATTTRGPGRGGAVDVAADEIVLEGSDSGLFARAEGARGNGGGGALTVNAGSLMVKEGAKISASTSGPGSGGKLSITAADLELRDGASITSESTSGGDDAGQSGEIFIQATDTFRLFNDSQVSVETARADARDIDLKVGFLLHLRDSSITTSVAKGEGSGGDIRIDPVFTILDSGSRIVAQAREGAGGEISIASDFFFASPDSVIDASSGNPELSGTVEIDSPETDVISSALELPESFLDVTTLLTQACAPGADLSRLVVRKYEVLPDSPAALRVPAPGGLLNADTQDAGVALTRETPGPGFEHASACGGDG